MRYAGTLAVLLSAAVGSVGPQSAEAQNLVVNSGTTTISTAQNYGSTTVAQNVGDTATLAVTSTGTLANSFYLYVGNRGTGTLNVNGGSVTNTSDAYLGYSVGGIGTATVSSGTWANSSQLYVGDGGTGTLNVNGGRVTNTDGFLGYDAGGVGTATVSSGTWANSYFFGVGMFGTGTLNVNGGSVTNTYGFLGYNAGGVGTATVSSGTWANSNQLYVGFSGTGTLNVNGGSVTNTDGFLGYDLGGVGTATVSSGTWANSGDLAVGVSGTGTLTMGGGLVTVGGTLSQGIYGTINLNSGGKLQIGEGGTTGVLGVSTLTNNGTLVFSRSDASTYSGVISGTGAVTKEGAGALTLDGTNLYTGPTTINGGSLFVNGKVSGAVNVNAGTLLGGSGTVAGAVGVASGGTLAPGATADIRLSPFGAPLLDDVFRQAHDRARHDTLCFVNADIVFRGDVTQVLGLPPPFLVIGESLDVDLRTPVEYGGPDWRGRLPSGGVSRGPLAIDWFFFNRGLFAGVPSFSIGRARFDNWLVWRAQRRNAAVIDGTTAIDALHQRHDYGHLAGGRREAYRGVDARRNQALAGMWCYLYLHSILDAGWTLTPNGLQPRSRGIRFLGQLRLRLSGLWTESISPGPSRPRPGRA